MPTATAPTMKIVQVIGGRQNMTKMAIKPTLRTATAIGVSESTTTTAMKLTVKPVTVISGEHQEPLNKSWKSKGSDVGV